MDRISLSGFADKLADLMLGVWRAIVKREACELFKGKITLPQFVILNILYKEGETKMSDIARFLDVSTAAATGLVARLVKCGYLVRVYDPHDRRIIRIKLSAKGGELLKKTTQARREMIIDIFGRISQDDREAYLRILSQVLDILNEGKKS